VENKIILFGYGFLGKNIYFELEKKGLVVIKTKLEEMKDVIQLDISDHKKISDLIDKEKPDIVINCAGRNDIDFLEKNPEQAIAINSIGPEIIAKKCEEYNSRLVHISTDSIFDGQKGMYDENDVPNPKNIYAKTKLEGEKKVTKECSNSVIVRTNFYGIDNSRKYLFNNMLEKLKQKQDIIGFDDVHFTPLSVENLSQQITDVTFSNYNGIIHLGSDKKISKYEFCKIMAQKLGFGENYVKQGSIDNLSFIAERPKNTSLNNKVSKSIVKHKSIEFEDWLESKKDEIMELHDLKNV
jgi:dTDP-4-dehydrorhamnose reductase